MEEVVEKNKIPISLLKMEEQRLSAQWIMGMRQALSMNPTRNES